MSEGFVRSYSQGFTLTSKTADYALCPASDTGLVFFISDGWRRRLVPYLLSYAAGTMLATAIIGLLPEALEGVSIHDEGIALLTGLVLFFVLEWTTVRGGSVGPR